MKLAQLEWQRFLTLLPQWDALEPDLRLEWLKLQPAKLYTVAFPGQNQALVSGGWLTPIGGEHYEVPRRRRYFHRVLRALSRVPVLDDYGHGDLELLVEYVTEHYSPRDCATLGRTDAATGRAELASEMDCEEWLRDFLLWEGPGPRAEGPAERWRRAMPAAISTAREMIETVQEHGAPVSLAEMLAVADQTSQRNALALGLGFVSREALLLFGLDAGAQPFVGLWRASRSTPGADVRAPAPEFVDTLPLFCRPLLVDDMAALLVESMAVPPRLKADRSTLFARAREAIGAALTALPGWIRSDDGPLAIEVRVDMAALSARRLGLAAVTGTRGKDLSLTVTEHGRHWLTLDAQARLKQVLDMVREGAEEFWYSGEESPYAGGRESEVAALNLGLDYLPYDPGLEYPWVHRVDCRAAVTDAFRSVADAAVVCLADFVGRECRERNPLTAIAYMPYLHEGDIAEQWQTALYSFFNRRLIALGGVALGPLTDGQVGFRVTPAGRYLLGETDQLQLGAPEETGDVLVQPNFEIVFLAPSVEAQLRARSLAEPTDALEGSDSVGTLFVLRRESVQRAVMAGQDRDRIIASLHELSKHPLPKNVERQVSAWASEVRWIEVRPAVVVDCGDAETAARVLAVAGKAGRNLSPTTVELLSGTKLTPAIRKKLQAAGIFIRQ